MTAFARMLKSLFNTPRRATHRLGFEPLEDRATPATFVVTSTADAGPGSLREAVALANAAADADLIDLSQVAGQITLTSGEIFVTAPVEIAGPGAGVLAVSGNDASRVLNVSTGGAITVRGLTLTRGRIDAGLASFGGAVSVGVPSFPAGQALAFTLRDAAVTDSRGDSGGGGVFISGPVTAAFENVTVEGNRATDSSSFGGGLYQQPGGSLRVMSSQIVGNTAGSGGGVAVSGGVPSEFEGVRVEGNRANGLLAAGGGLYQQDGTLRVANSLVRGNASASTGGGIEVLHTAATITGSAVVENASERAGGGGLYVAEGSALIENSTVANNLATGNPYTLVKPDGGGLFTFNTTVTLRNSTVAANTAVHEGGGVYSLANSTITVVGSIVADNVAPAAPDIGAPAKVTFSLVGSTRGWTVSAGSGSNLTSVDALLAPLASPGGGLPVIAPRPGSPARDPGFAATDVNPAGLTTDQRGRPRLAGAWVDLGAFEASVAAAPAVSDLADRTVPAGGTTGPVGFTVGDPDTPAGQLAVVVESDNPTLLPPSVISVGGSGADRTLTVTPAAGLTGRAVVRVTVVDPDGGATTDTFTLTVPGPGLRFAFDYRYDTAGFFNDPARRAALERVAGEIGSRFGDTLAAITPASGDTWQASFTDPASSSFNFITLDDLTIPANTVTVFVAARDLGFSTLGQAARGTAIPTASVTPDWPARVVTRGQIGAFETTLWGGAVAFDSDTNWYFGADRGGVGRDQADFAATAAHELFHLLGFSVDNPAFAARTAGGSFAGPAVAAVAGGPVAVGAIDKGHWAAATPAGVPALMNPSAESWVPAVPTALDWAALRDLGWSVPVPAATAVTVTGPGSVPNNSSVSFTVTLAAAGGVPTGTVVLRSQGRLLGSAPLVNGVATVTTPVAIPLGSSVNPAFLPGANTITALYLGDGTFAPSGGTAQLTVTDFTSPVPPVPPIPPISPAPLVPPAIAPNTLVGVSRFAVGADRGTLATADVYSPSGELAFRRTPFDRFTGGARVAVADVTGDGVPDLVVGTGPGVATDLRVIDGADPLAEPFRVAPFEPSFTGGVYVAAGDLDGDGVAEIVVSPDEGGGPRLRVFAGRSFAQLADFFGIDDPNFRGGARAALGDVNGDGKADLLVAAGFGGGPRVAIFDGSRLGGSGGPKLTADFFLFEPELRNGAFVAAGDVDGDGRADVVGGGGPGGGPRVYVLSGRVLVEPAGRQAPLANFFAGDVGSRGGIRVAVKDLDGDARADLVVGASSGGRATAYLGRDITGGGTPPEFRAIDPFAGFTGGVFVG